MLHKFLNCVKVTIKTKNLTELVSLIEANLVSPITHTQTPLEQGRRAQGGGRGATATAPLQSSAEGPSYQTHPSSKRSAKDPLIPSIRSAASFTICVPALWRRQFFPKVDALKSVMIRLINHLVVVFVSLSVMICSKSHNNLYRISTFLECLIKLLYLIRSNINNTKFVVVGTL